MGEYCSARVWRARAGVSTTEIEALATSGLAEMFGWIPGVRNLALVRQERGAETRYLLITTFRSEEAYKQWRRIEAEGPDYWERYASILIHWEQLVDLLEEYHGDSIPLMGEQGLVRNDV